MWRLILALALMACPAAAECFGPTLPQMAVDSGDRVFVVRRTATDVTFRTRQENRAGFLLTTVRNGFFTTSRTEHSLTANWDWYQELPEPATWVPGMEGHFDALKTDGSKVRTKFSTDLKILRREAFEVAGCTYPVIVAELQDTEGQETALPRRVWYAPDLGMVLRIEEPCGKGDEQGGWTCTHFRVVTELR